MAVIEVTEADDGRVIPAEVGDEVVVRLPERGSTGYLWDLEEAGDPSLVLERSDAEAGAMPGAPGERRLVFRVAAASRSQVVLERRRGSGGEKHRLEEQLEIHQPAMLKGPPNDMDLRQWCSPIEDQVNLGS